MTSPNAAHDCPSDRPTTALDRTEDCPSDRPTTALDRTEDCPSSPVAVVTGGNRGIGLELCRLLAERGYLVVLGGRDADKGGRPRPRPPRRRPGRRRRGGTARPGRPAGDRLVNAVSPGWTATDMGGPGGRPVAEGAASVLWGVTLPDDGPTGGFFQDGAHLPW